MRKWQSVNIIQRQKQIFGERLKAQTQWQSLPIGTNPKAIFGLKFFDDVAHRRSFQSRITLKFFAVVVGFTVPLMVGSTKNRRVFLVYQPNIFQPFRVSDQYCAKLDNYLNRFPYFPCTTFFFLIVPLCLVNWSSFTTNSVAKFCCQPFDNKFWNHLGKAKITHHDCRSQCTDQNRNLLIFSALHQPKTCFQILRSCAAI